MLAAGATAAEPAQQDPAAVAATLEQQAAEYRAAADKHEKMGKMHRGGAGSSKVNHEGIVKHCDALVQNLRAAAQESEPTSSAVSSSVASVPTGPRAPCRAATMAKIPARTT